MTFNSHPRAALLRRVTLVAVPCAAAALAAALVAGPVRAHQQPAGEAAPRDDHSRPPAVPDFPGVKVLFSGKPEELRDLWEQNGHEPVWKVQRDGCVEVTPNSGDIGTKEKFQDFQLHVEFKEPYMPEAKGQGRGNSGVFLQSRYEIQVLDSYGWKVPGKGDCAAVYDKAAPLVNACKPPLQWQTYDITFRSARLDPDGKVVERPRVTVVQNGITVQNNTQIPGVTGAAEDNREGTPGRIRLQDHHNRMRFRNIWILPLPTESSTDYNPH